MGAGSAKGINSSPEDEGDIENDRFSMVSHDSPEPIAKIQKTNNEKNKKPLPLINKHKSLESSDDEEDTIAPSNGTPVKKSPVKKSPEKKRGGLFGFSKWKDDDEDKTSAPTQGEKDTKEKDEGKKGGGFRLFGGWRKDDKKEQKDETLDEEIDDLHKTFDSLGIDTKGNNKKKDKKSQSADDIRKLSPMRSKANIKPRPLRTSHARRNGENILDSLSGGNRRNFKYSWETEQTNSTSIPIEDQWSYKAVGLVIHFYYHKSDL